MSIRKLNANTVRLVSSTINVSSVGTVVKELVENAIDAGATSVIIRLDKHGLTRIEVRDNGSGISKVNVPLVGLVNHTSKITDFSDLDKLESYGFRGQAISALCAISDVSIITRTKDDEIALSYTLDQEGRMISSKPSHLGVGTTVIVENLFGRIPVRHKMLLASKPSILKTVLRLLRYFALAKPSLGLTLFHDNNFIWRKCSASTLSSSAQEVLDYNVAVKMESLSWKGTQCPMETAVEEDDENVLEVDDPVSLEMEVEMLIPKKGTNILEMCSYPSSDGFIPNVYLLINGRIVKHKKIDQLMNCWICRGTLGDLPKRKKPCWILKMNIPSNLLDVNLEVDKSKVLLRCEDMVLKRLEQILSEYYLITDEGINIPISAGKSEPSEKRRKIESKISQKEMRLLPTNESSQMPNGDDVLADDIMSVNNTSLLSLADSRAVLDGEDDRMGINTSKETCSNNNLNHLEASYSELRFKVSNDRCTEKITHGDIIEIRIPPLSPDSGVNLGKEIGLQKFVIEEESNLKDDNFHLSSFEMENTITKDRNAGKEEMGRIDGECNADVRVKGQNGEEEVHLPDLDAWSRGNAVYGGVRIPEPVKVLQPISTAPSIDLDAEALEREFNTEFHPDAGNSNTNPLRKRLSAPGTGNEPPTINNSKFPPKNRFSEPSSEKYHSNLSSNDNPALNSPVPNACSQIGRRDLRAFAEFSSEERPKIIQENPGIKFPEVAAELSKHWKSLSMDEQDVYAKRARAKQQQKRVSSSSVSEKEQNLRQQTLPKSVMAPPCQAVQAPSSPVVGMVTAITVEEIENLVIRSQRKKLAVVLNKSKIVLIGQLRPSGMWVCRKGNEIGIVRHFAVQELVVYEKLMKNLKIPLKPLLKPLELNESLLGPELWTKLISMENQYDVFTDSIWVTSFLIAKNGFRIKISKGETGDVKAFVTEVASVFPSYGVTDLKEILSKINSSDCNLSECRPRCVTNYIEAEATRICRQSPPVMVRDELSEILKDWDENPLCLHNKPVFVSLHQLSNQEEESSIEVFPSMMSGECFTETSLNLQGTSINTTFLK